MTRQELEQVIRLVLAMLEKFEGLYLKPYLCPAGVWTIGLGTTRYPDGRPVRPTDAPITREVAWTIARAQLIEDYLPAVLKLCPTLDKPTRVAAIADFCYNLGSAALRSSTLRKKILAMDWEAVPEQLLKWVMGGGRRLKGLERRRQFEIIIWNMK